MSLHPWEYEEEESILQFLDEELRRIAEEPVFLYLARNGDAIEERVARCRQQAEQLRDAGYAGASLVRATAGIEITIRFFLARPLLQGAFLSEEWARLVSKRILQGRSAEDRELLPAILRNWDVDITGVVLPSGHQMWECLVDVIWKRRNEYVHKGEDCSIDEAELALAVLSALLTEVVSPIARRFGFTREATAAWSVVNPTQPGSVTSQTYERSDPF